VGTKIATVFDTFFKVDFRLLVAVSGPYGIVCTIDCGHKFRGTKHAVQQYRLGTEIEADFGIVLVCCKWTFFGWKL
jgi:hypothetical protein